MSIVRQNRAGSSHHFSYPAPGAAHIHHHFQTMQAQHLIANGGGTTEMAMLQPMTGSLLISTSSNNPSTSTLGFLAAKQLQQQQQSQQIPSYMPLLEQQPWFHGKITRKQAESLLENMPIGSFLVRSSESGNLNDFSLSLV